MVSALISFMATIALALVSCEDPVSSAQDGGTPSSRAVDTPASPLAKAGYLLDFNDEFDSNALNVGRWYPYYLSHWASTKAATAARYAVRNGALEVRLEADQLPWNPTYDGQIKVSSIASYEKNYLHRFAGTGMTLGHSEPEFNGYTTKYGYFEIRAKGPNSGGGGHAAWWMIGTQDDQDANGLNYTQAAEIDVTETVLSNMSGGYPKLHPWTDFSITDWGKGVTYTGDPANEYHLYGMNWTPAGLDFFYDNRLVAHTNGSPNYRMMTMFSLYTAPSMWSGNDNGVYPKVWYIDYFRVYKPINGYSSNTGYYYVVNRNNSQQLNIEGKTGRVESNGNPKQDWWSAQWSIENHDGYTRFKNRWTGEYMNEQGTPAPGYVAYSALGNPNWWSADYALENHDGYTRLKNRQTGTYVNNEGNKGYAESTALGNPNWWSADWAIIPIY